MLRLASHSTTTPWRRVCASSLDVLQKKQKQRHERITRCFGERRSFFSWSTRQQHQDSSFRSFGSRKSAPTRDSGLEYTSVVSHPEGVDGPKGVPSRADQIQRLSSGGEEYDLLVIGGGATGAGVALDAASRGYRVACIERGDFSSETSSRSTKLIWAGIKYMGTAVAAVLSTKIVTNPISAMQDFLGEMKMVLHCHRERRYMMDKQSHLCQWIPILIPFDRWHVSPPPFGHVLYGFFPILAPFVLKFYDGLSSFSCPPSYVMSPAKTKTVFPQIDVEKLKYCAVFYEAKHNDARTNMAIAMTAAQLGAHICNYVEMVDTIVSEDASQTKVVGVAAVDRTTNEKFDIRARKIIFCGGPFTDDLRRLESRASSSSAADNGDVVDSIQPAVLGAHGTHVCLKGYYCPSTMGLLDYNTTDGRFLFYLPFQNHTLIGTTDAKTAAETLPGPVPADEVDWILKEASKYLAVPVRQQDVTSVWRGWRPLAVDPHAPPDAPVSRDHVISENPDSGILFVAGGKWTTWREMSEEVVDRALGAEEPCRTLDITLFGGDGYSEILPVEISQKYSNISQATAQHLTETYGGRVWEVLEMVDSNDEKGENLLLLDGYPYLQAEVKYACREYACTIEDVLSRRTRLAFLNQKAALQCIPIVADLMAKELKWTASVKKQQMTAAEKYIESYSSGGGGGVGEGQTGKVYHQMKDVTP